jgi:hypothetical protein
VPDPRAISQNGIEMTVTDNPRRRIDEELVAVDSLKQVLCLRCACQDVIIHRERQDPPDFTLEIDGEAFPAEVTSIVSHQEYHARCNDYLRALMNRLATSRILSGKYQIIVSRQPHVPKLASNDGRHILDTAIAYISATRDRDFADENELAKDDTGKMSIRKVSPNGSSVDLYRSPSALWEGEIRSELTSLIQQAVNRKRVKLQNAGIAQGAALLLLYDAFAYAEPEDAQIALRQVIGYEWFHSIYWAASFTDRRNATYPDEPGRDGLFLYSRNSNWIGPITASVEADT